MREFWMLAALVAVAPGCANSRPAKVPDGQPSDEPSSPPNARTSSAKAASNGSSDGMTCEQAQAEYVEEIGMERRGPADLTAADLGAVLNAGTYLDPCDVAPATQVQICVAVRNGGAIGVTVTLDPPDAALEVCVARQVRELSFPVHPKMDIARVRF
jgi:hypothetical protein